MVQVTGIFYDLYRLISIHETTQNMKCRYTLSIW